MSPLDAIAQVCSPQQFIAWYLPTEHGMSMPPWETIDDRAYHELVAGNCHNACAWFAREVKRELPQLLPHLYWCTGGVRIPLFSSTLTHDHSWIDFRQGKITLIDLTYCQFERTAPRLYVGPKPESFVTYAEIGLAQNPQEISAFAAAL